MLDDYGCFTSDISLQVYVQANEFKFHNSHSVIHLFDTELLISSFIRKRLALGNEYFSLSSRDVWNVAIFMGIELQRVIIVQEQEQCFHNVLTLRAFVIIAF